MPSYPVVCWSCPGAVEEVGDESGDFGEVFLQREVAGVEEVEFGVGEGDSNPNLLRAEDDPLYAAYVLILVLGLRRGEVLGLAWDGIDLVGEEGLASGLANPFAF